VLPNDHRLLALTLAISCLALTRGGEVSEPPADQTMVVSASPKSARPGDVVVLTMRVPQSATTVQIRAFDRDVPSFSVSPRTWRALVGVDLDTSPGTYSIAIESGDLPQKTPQTFPLVVATRRFRTRTLTVDAAFVNPPPAALERIARETAELNDLWSKSSGTRLWTGPFIRPVPDPANSAFGTRSILNGEPRSPHSGADFDSPEGRPIKAPNAGLVVLAGERYFTGNTVMIDHGLGLFSLFAHLSVIQVHAGDSVNTGDVVGKVGATGRVTGPHLHWSVRLNGARVDPLSLLAVLGSSVKRE
jgi:murein DD-endopeptidase MepM/ murein hydrolase activator NlpD